MRGPASLVGRRRAPRRRSPGTTAPALLLAAGLAAALAASALLATPAHASFEPIELQSVVPGGQQFEKAPAERQQFEEAKNPAISANGRYLVFEGTLDGVPSIWRKDLQSGALQVVVKSGNAPSISADGRYVSFSSGAALDKDAKSSGNVYVRDMDVESNGRACTSEQESEGQCPYELASALNGSSEGFSSAASTTARVSLSANGREVAFETGGQIYVRYLAPRDETVLVSAEREQSTGQMTERPVAGGAVFAGGAALSGDGSTVAWLGANIPAQAPTLEGERQQIERDDAAPTEYDEAYDEPLWRRIADGPTAPTRRMVGGGDPLAPGCPPGGTIEIPACQGPFPELPTYERGGDESSRGWLGISGYNGTPQLSYDGWTAALIGDPDSTANVFVVNMEEGLDRDQALHELTREVPVPNVINPGDISPYLATDGDIYETAISPDGSRIAFTTQREQFPLAGLNFTEAPLTQPGVVELYEVVDGEALERVTHGPDDGPSLEGPSPVIVRSTGASAPSFSENGSTVAFADTASNLVYGDVNEASDVFTATETPSADVAGPAEIGPVPPAQEPAVPQWRLSVVPVTHADGSVTLDVVVPGAGELSASATATVPVTVSAHLSRLVHGRARKQRAKPAKRVELKSRTVASARMPTALAGLLELPLRVAGSYTKLLGTTAGLYATVRVTFTGAGGPELSQSVTVSLHEVEPKTKQASKKKKRKVSKRSKKSGKARTTGASRP